MDGTTQAAQKPRCQLVGTNGNAFAIIGTVERTLKQAGQRERAAEFIRNAFDAESYDALLQLVMTYVEVE